MSLNGDIEKDGNVLLTKENAIDGKFVVIRRGKKKYYVATFC